MTDNNTPLEKYRYLDSIEGFHPAAQERQPLWQRGKAVAPGVLLCAAVALAAAFISQHYAMPVMLLCLLLGMVFHFMSQEAPTRDGIHFTAQSMLRIGVALIGARIMLSDFTALGLNVLLLVVAATLIIIGMGVIWARALRLDRNQGYLIGGATAICGASAALALSAVMPGSRNLDRNTLIAVIGVTAMGALAMIFYPAVLGLLGLGDREAGILIGGTIHDVSQVVGAGYSISPEAGDTAILVKLIRVFLLVPLLLVFALSFRRRKTEGVTGRYAFPYFLIGFLVLAGMNSAQVIPLALSDLLQTASKGLLVMAITAVGMKTSLRMLFSLGWRPVALIVLETATLSALYFAVILWGLI